VRVEKVRRGGGKGKGKEPWRKKGLHIKKKAREITPSIQSQEHNIKTEEELGGRVRGKGSNGWLSDS